MIFTRTFAAGALALAFLGNAAAAPVTAPVAIISPPSAVPAFNLDSDVALALKTFDVPREESSAIRPHGRPGAGTPAGARQC